MKFFISICIIYSTFSLPQCPRGAGHVTVYDVNRGSSLRQTCRCCIPVEPSGSAFKYRCPIRDCDCYCKALQLNMSDYRPWGVFSLLLQIWKILIPPTLSQICRLNVLIRNKQKCSVLVKQLSFLIKWLQLVTLGIFTRDNSDHPAKLWWPCYLTEVRFKNFIYSA